MFFNSAEADDAGAPRRVDDEKKAKRTTVSEIVVKEVYGISCGTWGCIFMLLAFPGPFWALCHYVDHDPNAVLIDGQPMPPCVDITSVAFLTCLLLDIFTWTWTIEPSKSAMFAFPLTVETLSLISYVGLATGYCPILSSFDGRRFIPSRHLKWLYTTPLMLVTYAVLCDITVSEFLICVVSDILMLVFGALASYCVQPHNYVYLMLSFMFYFPVVYYINAMLELAIASYSAEQTGIRKAFNSARIVMLMGWVSMPLIWILAWGGLIDAATEEIGYEVVDFLTKCGCSCMLMHSSLRTQADREAERSRVALHEERGRMVEVLQQTTIQREKFFAALSSQLRSPLACMAGLVEDLLSETSESSAEEQSAQLNAFITAGTHLVFTIDDILSISQKKQKQRGVLLPVVMWEADACQMLEEVVHLMRGLATDNALSYQIHVEGEVPKIRVDVRRAHQALHNVLAFVAYSSMEQGLESRVDITVKASADRATVSILIVAPDAPLGSSPQTREIIQRRLGHFSGVEAASLRPETYASAGLWSVGLDQPEDAARDESLQCLLIAKDLLTQTGGMCSLMGSNEEACSLIVILPSSRSTSFGSPAGVMSPGM